MSKLVQIFCKLPQPGKVKTRLAKSLGDTEAAQLSAALAKRTIEALSKSFKTEIWFTFEDQFGFLNQFHDVNKREQVGSDLGERMQFSLLDGLKHSTRVVLVGSDCPCIDAAYVAEAFERLNGHEVVLGPAEDGGYGLIGVKDKVPLIFDEILWGSVSVMSDTCRRLNAAGTYYALLPLIWDVDRPADAERYYDLLQEEQL